MCALFENIKIIYSIKQDLGKDDEHQKKFVTLLLWFIVCSSVIVEQKSRKIRLYIKIITIVKMNASWISKWLLCLLRFVLYQIIC